MARLRVSVDSPPKPISKVWRAPERVLTPLYNTAESETLSFAQYRENLLFTSMSSGKNRVLNFAIWQSLDNLTVSFVIFHQIFDLPTVFQKMTYE